MTAVSAHDVAAELRRQMPSMGAAKLQKLLYYVQGHHLATFGEPAFRERLVAWDLGPVVESVWREPGKPGATIGDEKILSTIGYVVSHYGRLWGGELIDRTHEEQPWMDADARRKERGARSEVISTDALTQFFTGQQQAQRSIPPGVFRDLFADVDMSVLPPADPIEPQELLARVQPGV